MTEGVPATAAVGNGSFENACRYQGGRFPGEQEDVEHP